MDCCSVTIPACHRLLARALRRGRCRRVCRATYDGEDLCVSRKFKLMTRHQIVNVLVQALLQSVKALLFAKYELMSFIGAPIMTNSLLGLYDHYWYFHPAKWLRLQSNRSLAVLSVRCIFTGQISRRLKYLFPGGMLYRSSFS